MSPNLTLSVWAYGLASLLYAGLTVWQLVRGERLDRPLLLAMASSSAWAACVSFSGASASAMLAEAVRNLCFLTFMYGMVSGLVADRPQTALKAVYSSVAGAIALQMVFSLVAMALGNIPAADTAFGTAQHGLNLLVAAGSIILLHNLYGQSSPASRQRLQMPVIALSALWAYDLHFYAVAFFTGGADALLFAMRGLLAALLVPLFMLASKEGAEWRVQLSRRATFQSLSIIAILLYLILMMALSSLGDMLDGTQAIYGQLTVAIPMTVLALMLLPSQKVRGWIRVIVSKHFFEHRYDYREDWLRFTRAVGQVGDERHSLGERVVKALADMAGSSSGLLLMFDENGRFGPAATWNWEERDQLAGEASADFVHLLSAGFVIDFAGLQDGMLLHERKKIPVPARLVSAGAWAGIPLTHNDKLVGLALLSHPAPRRALDWEDYDLFRTAGMQAASYIAEARSQEALADVQKFDEFNRRFAFIMHDIKNLVSQLSLVARNAERHADNPEFRADMVATLQSSVKKMNDLLARLSRGRGAEARQPTDILLQPLIAAVVETKRRAHPLHLEGDARLGVKADPIRLEQAIAHVLQNAIDASAPQSPVRISFVSNGHNVTIEIADQGEGMSADFIRSRLFQPFASTKDGGFGIGAFEARALITSMGGQVEVSSRPGEGTRFTIHLPIGEGVSCSPQQRMRA